MLVMAAHPVEPHAARSPNDVKHARKRPEMPSERSMVVPCEVATARNWQSVGAMNKMKIPIGESALPTLPAAQFLSWESAAEWGAFVRSRVLAGETDARRDDAARAMRGFFSQREDLP